jgi:sarcosine oxidase subunit alpha
MATTVELYEGLLAKSQNRWPSLRFDLQAVNSALAPILSTGFYYKTFMWPPTFWEKIYEPLIRRAAGLGRAAAQEDPDTYEKAFLHCDVLIVGAGATGLMAALAAGRTGARVVLADEDFRLGGRLLSENRMVGERRAADWAAHVIAELQALPGVRILSRTTIIGIYDGGTYSAVERVNDHLAVPPEFEPRQRLWRIFAKRCVLAAGAIERPLVFGDNDRPGVMLASAVRTYLNRYAAVPGHRAVVFGVGDDIATTVHDLVRAGATVEAVVDARTTVPEAVKAAAKAAGARMVAGGVVSRALGRMGVHAVDVRTDTGQTISVNCDLVCVSGGWNPTLHLTSHLGAAPIWDEAIGAFVPGNAPKGVRVAGAAAGKMRLREALATGARAGLEAADDCGFAGQQVELPEVQSEPSEHSALWRVSGTRGKALHHSRNGNRSGQNVRGPWGSTHGRADCAKPGADRSHNLPAAICTRCHWRFGRAASWASLQTYPFAAFTSLGAGIGRGLCRNRAVVACAVVLADWGIKLARQR